LNARPVDGAVEAEVGRTAVGGDGTVVKAFSEGVVPWMGENLMEVLYYFCTV
jgi:hypothetical protein